MVISFTSEIVDVEWYNKICVKFLLVWNEWSNIGITPIQLLQSSCKFWAQFFFKTHKYCPYQKWQHKEGSSLLFEFSDSIVVNSVATQTLNTGNIWERIIKKELLIFAFFFNSEGFFCEEATHTAMEQQYHFLRGENDGLFVAAAKRRAFGRYMRGVEIEDAAALILK